MVAMSSKVQTRFHNNYNIRTAVSGKTPNDETSFEDTSRSVLLHRVNRAPGTLTPGEVLQLQRTIGNRAVNHLLGGTHIQRVPYATPYILSKVKTILNQSEGRASPVTGAEGHPRQHVGKWEKAERFADKQGKTKSVFVNTAAQDAATLDALNSAAGQQQLATLDANPAVPARAKIENVDIGGADVLVVKAKKKKDTGNVKSWDLKAGTATRATLMVDSRGTGTTGDIHIQTSYPVLD